MNRLDEILDWTDKTEAELAKGTDIAQSTISSYRKKYPHGALWIAKCAKYLGVTSDYLLGLSDVKQPDTTIQAISNYTGLSEDAIEKLRFISPEMRSLLSDIICSEEFEDLLMWFECGYSEMRHETERRYRHKGLYNTDSIDVNEYRATRTIASIFRSIMGKVRSETMKTLESKE